MVSSKNASGIERKRCIQDLASPNKDEGHYIRRLDALFGTFCELFKAYGVVAQTSLMIFTCLVVRHCRLALSVFVLEKNKAAYLQNPLPFTSPTAEVKGCVEPHVVQETLRR